MFLNKQKTIGINTHIEFFRRKKTYYQTIFNQLIYFENIENSYTSNEFLFDFEIIYKRNLNTKHKLNLNYQSVKIDQEIAILNPNYLLSGYSNRTISDFYKLSYQYIKEKSSTPGEGDHVVGLTPRSHRLPGERGSGGEGHPGPVRRGPCAL